MDKKKTRKSRAAKSVRDLTVKTLNATGGFFGLEHTALGNKGLELTDVGF
jgi:hypothetical protein